MTMYNRGKALDKNWVTDTFKVMLVKSTYTPNVDHDFVSDVVADEASGTGYSRITLANKAIVIDDANDRADHNADTVLWAALTAAFKYAVIFKFVTNDADSILHEYIDLGAQSLTALPFSIQWNAGVVSGTVMRGT